MLILLLLFIFILFLILLLILLFLAVDSRRFRTDVLLLDEFRQAAIIQCQDFRLFLTGELESASQREHGFVPCPLLPATYSPNW